MPNYGSTTRLMRSASQSGAVELIPVIEIGYSNRDIAAPVEYTYWEHSTLWDEYNAACYTAAGFKDPLKPYLAGSSLYRLWDISKTNLIKITKDHTEHMLSGKYGREQVSPFFGGYVLRIGEKNKYFPQCCGDLSDIRYWETIAAKKTDIFHQGHPEPVLKFKDDHIIFDFTTDDRDESFSPPPPENIVTVDITALKQAIEIVKIELDDFSELLKEINDQENLGIEDIEKLLVWGDD